MPEFFVQVIVESIFVQLKILISLFLIGYNNFTQSKFSVKLLRMHFTCKNKNSLLALLQERLPESSNRSLRTLIEKERILVDGKLVRRADVLVEEGSAIVMRDKIQFLEQNVRLLYEDGHIAVIDKPEGLLSVATDFESYKTAHGVLKRRRPGKMVYPVHRLDRETSGVLVFAYTEKAREGLKDQFMRHSLQREYVALLEGNLEKKQGTWKSLLEEDPFYYVKNSPTGKLSITHYEVISGSKTHSFVRFQLETGRKNQIRVHASSHGHPIAGDTKYGAKTNPAKRLCLHAEKLGFIHPVTGKKLFFQSPIPEFYSMH